MRSCAAAAMKGCHARLTGTSHRAAKRFRLGAIAGLAASQARPNRVVDTADSSVDLQHVRINCDNLPSGRAPPCGPSSKAKLSQKLLVPGA